MKFPASFQDVAGYFIPAVRLYSAPLNARNPLSQSHSAGEILAPPGKVLLANVYPKEYDPYDRT